MNKPRKPWLAVLLSFVSMGLGHIYTGEARRGILLLLAGYLIGSLILFSFLFPPAAPILGMLFGLFFFLFCLRDSYKIAKSKKDQFSLKKYNRWYVYLLFWLVGGVVSGTFIESTLKTHIAQAYKIPAGSMLNTLQIGDHIVCNKLSYVSSSPRRGDVVIFPYPKDPSVDYVKRVIGLPGDEIEIKNKKVHINGNPLSEQYAIYTERIIAPDVSPRDNMQPRKIPVGMYFVMGDNRDNSHDSRFWGLVEGSTIKGKVAYVYWSWDSDTFSARWHRIGKEIY